MDLLSMLKMANIFSPSGQTTSQNFPVGSIGGPDTPPVDASQAPPQQGMDLNSAIQGLLNPRDDQFNNYAQMIQSMPKESQYPPSNFRKIAGAIAGMGAGGPVGIANGQVVGYKSNVPEGMKIQKEITDEPYHKALEQWAMQLDPQGKIAQMEAGRNTNLRQIGLGELTRKQAQEKIDQQAIRDENTRQYQQGRLAISQQRADVAKFKATNPNLIIKEDSDGDLIGIDPQTAKSNKILDTDGNPVKSSVMTDAEKLQQTEANKEKEIQLRGTQSRLTEGFKQANRVENEATRQVNRIGLKETPPGVNPSKVTGSVTKPLTPAAESKAQVNKAVGIINEHPELKQYFVYGNNKQPTGELVPGKDPNDAGYAIAQRLMGKSGDISLDSGSVVSPQPSSAPPASRELVRPSNMPSQDRINSARKSVEKGRVLITDGKSFGQVTPEDSNRLPKGWMVVP